MMLAVLGNTMKHDWPFRGMQAYVRHVILMCLLPSLGSCSKLRIVAPKSGPAVTRWSSSGGFWVCTPARSELSSLLLPATSGGQPGATAYTLRSQTAPGPRSCPQRVWNSARPRAGSQRRTDFCGLGMALRGVWLHLLSYLFHSIGWACF